MVKITKNKNFNLKNILKLRLHLILLIANRHEINNKLPCSKLN